MKLIAITAREAEKLTKKLGLEWGDDQRTYYATDEDRTEIYAFDTKRERDAHCK